MASGGCEQGARRCAGQGVPWHQTREQIVGKVASLRCLSSVRARDTVACCPLQRHVEGNFKLGKWVSVQRHHKEFLLLERKRRLDAIGFVWDWRDNLWEQNFAALLKFKRREGHCCVPTFHREGDLKLGYWVATQRRTKKQISVSRRARLNKLGFVWKKCSAWAFFNSAGSLATLAAIRRASSLLSSWRLIGVLTGVLAPPRK